MKAKGSCLQYYQQQFIDHIFNTSS
uniref:Uncharacterized protein n=1 Tax=Rhizophora mucronata TaxID=61149 RepID=A0A2P2QJM5_RHIMU